MAEEKKAASRVRQVIGWYEEDPGWIDGPWPIVRYCDHCRCILHDDEPDGLCDKCAEAGL